MDFRDCQKLLSLFDGHHQAEGTSFPEALEVLHRVDSVLGKSTRPLDVSTRAELRRTLKDALLALVRLANRLELDLAEELETWQFKLLAETSTLAGELRKAVIPAVIERVTVYAASSDEARPSYLAAAEELGRLLALEGWTVVYGGGDIGLMGRLSLGVQSVNGRIDGVTLDRFVEKGILDEGAEVMKIVSTMRSRKRGLEEGGDAFVCLPGGFGTLEEILETLSFRHLGFHGKPIVLLNVEGYWDPLLQQLELGFSEKLIPERSRGLFKTAATAAEAVEHLRAWTPSQTLAPSAAGEMMSREQRSSDERG